MPHSYHIHTTYTVSMSRIYLHVYLAAYCTNRDAHARCIPHTWILASLVLATITMNRKGYNYGGLLSLQPFRQFTCTKDRKSVV